MNTPKAELHVTSCKSGRLSTKTTIYESEAAALAAFAEMKKENRMLTKTISIIETKSEGI